MEQEVKMPQEDIDSLVVIKEASQEKAYSIDNSNIELDVEADSEGNLIITGGVLTTPIMVQDTDIDILKTWRYLITGVQIQSLHINARENTIAYKFTAQDFTEATTLEIQKENA